MHRVLITGAGRGIGLRLSRLYAERDDTLVVACSRNPSAASELLRLAGQLPDRLRVVALDVADPSTISSARDALGRQVDGLEVLINNAGVYPGSVRAPGPGTAELGSLDMDAMMDVFRVNTLGPVLVTQAFVGLLAAGHQPRVINISSDAGSLGLRSGHGSYAYPASKAALNMFTRCLAADLRPKGILVASVHPGFIRTDMGGPSAPLAPEETLPRLLETIEGLTMEATGGFFNWDGKTVPW
jgi:NAD(P)-dependent dehydrogenase (short-subunit alcohol dehydrogenase family)